MYIYILYIHIHTDTDYFEMIIKHIDPSTQTRLLENYCIVFICSNLNLKNSYFQLLFATYLQVCD